MSTNSPFIDGSKDGQYSPKVDEHFFQPTKYRTNPGVATGDYTRKYEGGKDSMAEFLNQETGVNHRHNGAKGSYPRG